MNVAPCNINQDPNSYVQRKWQVKETIAITVADPIGRGLELNPPSSKLKKIKKKIKRKKNFFLNKNGITHTEV